MFYWYAKVKMPLERPLWVWWLVLMAALISFKGKHKNQK